MFYVYFEQVLIEIDPAAGGPLFEQVAAQIRRGVASGDLSTGDWLASARELSSCAPAPGGHRHRRRPRRAPLVDLARRLVAESRRLGM